MQIQLEDLDYQRRAIAAVVGVLDGQVKNTFDNSNLFGIQANITDLTPEQLEENKKRIIAENGIAEDDAKLSPDSEVCIEMETGTGKTLVYLHTVYALYKAYRLTKFIILVPSIAIKEGVLQSVDDFKKPLADLYGFEPSCFEYDSGKLSRLKHFIEDTQPQIMVTTIQSITSDDRIINQVGRDDSFLGLTFLQALGKCHPVIIMDEPQEGMDTENAVARLATLNPLVKLRYSATHKVVKTTVPSIRTNLFDSKTQALRSVLFSYAQPATQEFQKIFGGKKVFDNPKHFEDIRKLVDYLSDEGDIVLDFFAGSGSTAHAVMLANGRREFILVQYPEAISDKKATGKRAIELGLKKVSDITIERNKRVIAKFQKDAEELLPNDPQREFADGLGFKVFKLAKSHFPRVEFAPNPDKTEAENIELLKQYIRDKEATFHIQWERETVLDEVLLKNGFMLDYTLTPRPEFKKNEVFLAKDAHKESLVCLDYSIAAETVDHFKNNTEHFFICLELALDTTKKWNLKHYLGDKLKAF